MPADLFERWRELYHAEPWDAERTDLAIGQLIAYSQGTPGEPVKAPANYMPLLKRPEKKPQSRRELHAAWEAVVKIMEAREKTKKDPQP